jgi:hypothetical protein
VVFYEKNASFLLFFDKILIYFTILTTNYHIFKEKCLKKIRKMENEDSKVSKFSSGLNIIGRLDNLWRNCQEYKRKGRYSDWNDELDTIWLELARDIKQDEYKDKTNERKEVIEEGYKSRFSKFDEEMRKKLPFNDNSNGFNKPSEDSIKKRNEQYQILMEKQLFLARLENEVGKGTSWGEEEDDWD